MSLVYHYTIPIPEEDLLSCHEYETKSLQRVGGRLVLEGYHRVSYEFFNTIIFHVIPTITISTVLDDMIVLIIGFTTTVTTTVAMATVTTPAMGMLTYGGMPLPLGKGYINDSYYTYICSAWYL